VYMFFIITWNFFSKLLARVSTFSLLVDLCMQPNSNHIPCCVSVGGIGSYLMSCQHVGFVL
jgi:hypothetical protein